MKRVVVWCFVLGLFLWVIGCGNDEIDENENGETECLWGLCDNTYRSPNFSFNITELPIDTWTIEPFGENGNGKMLSSESGMKTYMMFLMEPNAEGKFINLDEGEYFDSILSAGMPFIAVWVYKYEWDIRPDQLPELVKAMYAGVELSEAKLVAGSNCNGYQVTAPLINDAQVTLSYFIKKDFMLSIDYLAQNNKYTQYVDVYNNIVKNLALMSL